MKIVRLQAENVKRIRAVEVSADALNGPLVKVGGRNGAGKSSVLDSIAYALGGQSLVPSEPIRKGQDSAKVEVDLGDLVVIRRFNRKRTAVEGEADRAEITSTLVVKNKDGLTYPSPQSVLDKLLGKLTFDPLAFARAKPTEQRDTLRNLTNLDTTLVDQQRQAAFDRRTEVNRELKRAEVQYAAAEEFDGVPDEEVSLDVITDELANAEALAKVANTSKEIAKSIQSDVQRLEREIADTSEEVINTRAQIAELEAQLGKLAEREKELHNQHEMVAAQLDNAKQNAKLAEENVPDTAALRSKISDAEQTNRKVRANHVRRDFLATVTELGKRVAEEASKIAKAEAEKMRILSTVQYPVEGLAIAESGVTFGGVPFEQASMSEQLKVSVAVGLALNPKLRVLLVRNGNALDEDSLKQVAEQAEAADAQVWVEWVTKSKEGVAVMIEDGAAV
jgi:DNA repair exonuclease SbcCD ATPase subunit